MKKRIAVSVGLVAIGTSAIHAEAADAPKPWAVSASLKAIYDDNYTTSQNNRQDSFGFEISPSASLNLALERTLIVGQYTYRYDWYQERNSQGLTPDDQSHIFNIDVTQTLSERLTASVGDEFAIAQEPELVDPSQPGADRANGDNIRNSGYLGLNALLTQVLSGSLNYNNTLIDYEEAGAQFAGPNLVNASRSGLLDRITHHLGAQLGWMASPTTTFFVGYGFDATCYTGDEVIAQTLGPVNIMSDARNAYSHIATVGARYAATEVLSASAAVGIQYTDYYNDPSHPTSTSPYADVSVSYLYTTASSLKVGLTHTRNATDAVSPDSNGRITQDQESTSLYLDISHQITPMLTANGRASAQASTFNSGAAGGKTDMFYSLFGGLKYTISEHFGVEAAYTYDNLDSDLVGRSFYRNRFSLGVYATY